MDLNYTSQELAFRDKVHDFLQAKLPKDLQAKVLNHKRLKKEDHVRWHKIVAAKGWAGASWPVQYGGPGWSPVQQHIWEVENGRAGSPGILPFDVNTVGPVIIAFGNEAQKRYYLPRILSCDDWWCHGYSELGSDPELASLKMCSERHGDHYFVNSQKTWTTLAQHADMILVWCAPILRRARRGWSCSKYLFGHERSNIAAAGRSKRELLFLKYLASEQDCNGQPLLDDPVFAAKVARFEMELMALEVTVPRVISQESGRRAASFINHH